MSCCSEPGGTAHLLPNLTHSARLLRRMGLAASSAEIADASRGLAHSDLARRDDGFLKLHGTLIFGQSGT